jgi:hypothetical protein
MVKKIEENIISRYSWIVILCSSCRLHNYGIQMNGYVELDEKKNLRREVKLQVYNVELITNYLHNM